MHHGQSISKKCGRPKGGGGEEELLAMLQEPLQLVVGVSDVMVNGVLVYRKAQPTGNYPGEFLKREGK